MKCLCMIFTKDDSKVEQLSKYAALGLVPASLTSTTHKQHTPKSSTSGTTDASFHLTKQ